MNTDSKADSIVWMKESSLRRIFWCVLSILSPEQKQGFFYTQKEDLHEHTHPKTYGVGHD